MNIIIIGGGASGMMASCIAAENKARVLLLEQNTQTGRKLQITGKGRCNLTNDCSANEVIENIPTGGKFLHSAINAFSPKDVMEMFAALGVALKTERGNRVFPCSDRAGDIVNALRGYMRKTGVQIRRCRALGIITDNGRVTGVSVSDGNAGTSQKNKVTNEVIPCEAVILATGGMSYPATGSTGDGYKMAKMLGHTITPIRGSLVPLVAQPELCSRMQGLTLKNIRLTVCTSDLKPLYTDFGELLFTHFGISGPVVLSASAHMRDFEKNQYHALIDFKPALDEKKLNNRILRDFQKYRNRDFANALDDLLPGACRSVIAQASKIMPDTKVHSVNREQRMDLVRLLKGFKIDIDRPRPVEEAIITSGGVCLKEINPKTMESKLVDGLYFAGEIIDADAYTGGFNLQIAWSTAYVSANAAASR